MCTSVTEPSCGDPHRLHHVRDRRLMLGTYVLVTGVARSTLIYSAEVSRNETTPYTLGDVHLSCLPQPLRSHLIGDLGLVARFAPLVEVVIITIRLTKKARREDCFEDTLQQFQSLRGMVQAHNSDSEVLKSEDYHGPTGRVYTLELGYFTKQV